MTHTEALKLALEALDNLMYWDNGKPDYDEAREAITAIKEALAQPEQIQPDKVCIEDDGCPTEKAVLQRFWREHQKTKPEQEPVACIGYWNQKTGAYYKPDQISMAHQKLIEDGILRRCYTTPPQRKPLTRAQIINALATTMNFNSRDYDEIIEPITRAIEAAHNIKE